VTADARHIAFLAGRGFERLGLKSAVKRVLRRWNGARIPTVTPRILRTLPHDPEAFTQGLLFRDGLLWESTGLIGSSSLRCLDPTDGRILRRVNVEGVWAEGIATHGDVLVQLTYRSGFATVYSYPQLRKLGELSYEGEGWGLTTMDDVYVMSNGSDVLRVRDADFQVVRELPVRLGNRPLTGLNDLEYANGSLYVNVHFDSDIFEVCPITGSVRRIVDGTGIVRRSRRRGRDDVLNGIAFAAPPGTFYVTGKRWKYLFEVNIPS
jgi:glutamine cyclotransferase